jgi:hypothetical protein
LFFVRLVASTARVKESSQSAPVESTDHNLAYLVDTRVSLRAAVSSPAVSHAAYDKRACVGQASLDDGSVL